jgi:ankyrin repeat protein
MDKSLCLTSYGTSVCAVKRLIAKQADVNCMYNNSTPLFNACEYNRTETVQYLIKLHANVNFTNELNETPLFCATRHNNITMIKY